MIDLYRLQQFAEFAKTGTLLKAAENLHLSQPALSRNMNALEEELGLRLFVRHKNKLELNETGRYVLTLARQLLEEAETLPVKAREYDRRLSTVSLGVCAPAPIWFLTPLIADAFPHMTLSSEMADNAELLPALSRNTYQLIAINQKPESRDFYFIECGKERLKFALPPHHRYRDRKTLSFSDINGEAILIFHDIGFWNLVRDKLPDSRFLTQNEAANFDELIKASSLTYFTTDQAETYLHRNDGRVHIPISDPESVATYYLVCRAEHKEIFLPLFQSVKNRLL